jgi:hypothetical protein
MTEIRFLLDLILTEKMSVNAKKKCIERIGEVEAKLQQPGIATQSPPSRVNAQVHTVDPNGIVQSASTLAALARQEVSPAPVQASSIQQHIPVLSAAQRASMLKGHDAVSSTTNGGETKGPRKF